MPWKERAKSVRRAFVCDADLRGKRLAVVDDVLSTGATLNELGRVRRKWRAGWWREHYRATGNEFKVVNAASRALDRLT
ncbi:MAG: hypothetical protein E6H47_13255 [Betaproteobacteria bacterium]|nr:MAG: hypothetical protein E6H47_13255 [Betaproteobacteria bacterium]